MRKIVNSYIQTDGNFTLNHRCGKVELNKHNTELNYDYTTQMIINLIKNKRKLIDERNQGSFNAAELLIDEEMYEEKYLSEEQREIIRFYYEKQMTITEIIRVLRKTYKQIRELIDSIQTTLEKSLEVQDND